MTRYPSTSRVGVVAALAAAVSLSCHASDDPASGDARYRLKVDTGPFRETIGQSGKYPLDRAYGRFTEEEKAALRADYEAMPDTDEPPFPEKGLKPIVTVISRLIGRYKLEGEVTIFVTVDSTGEATDVSLVKYPDLDTAKAIAYVLVQTKYKPAVCGGQPCKMQWAFRTRLVPQ